METRGITFSGFHDSGSGGSHTSKGGLNSSKGGECPPPLNETLTSYSHSGEEELLEIDTCGQSA